MKKGKIPICEEGWMMIKKEIEIKEMKIRKRIRGEKFSDQYQDHFQVSQIPFYFSKKSILKKLQDKSGSELTKI